jgi:hypothetical protein
MRLATILLLTRVAFAQFLPSFGPVNSVSAGGNPNGYQEPFDQMNFVITTGVAADTNWHHLKIYWVSSNKIAMTLDGGAPKTACPSGCDITAALNNNDVAAADCGSDTVGSLTTVDLDYFGFVATVGSR